MSSVRKKPSTALATKGPLKRPAKRPATADPAKRPASSRDSLTLVSQRLSPQDIMLGGIWLGPGGGDHGDGHRPDLGQDNADRTVKAALEAGIRDFDTAPWYGSGASEERLGRAIARAREEGLASNVRIYNKTGRRVKEASKEHPGHVVPSGTGFDELGRPQVTERVIFNDYSAEGSRKSLSESLERMRLPDVYGLRIHDPNDNSVNSILRGGENFVDEVSISLSTGGMLEGLRKLRADGAIQDVGLGMNCNREKHQGVPDEIMRLLRGATPGTFDSALLAGGWNLLSQEGHQCLQECERLHVAVHIAGVFASGLLVSSAGTYAYMPAPSAMVEKVERWRSLADKHGVSLPAVAIAFAALPKCVSRVVIGMATPEQVAETMAWVQESSRVPAAIWAEAKASGLLSAAVPLL